jgi:superfamily II DNA or RNA helicase
MSTVSIIADRRRVGFRTPYDAGRLDKLRALFKQNDGYWMAEAKAWTVTVGKAFSVAQGLRQLGYGICSDDELDRRLRAAQEDPSRALGQAVKLSLYALTDGRTAIRFAYDPPTIRALHEVDGLARFQRDADPKFWLSRKPAEILKLRLSARADINPDDIYVSGTVVDLATFGQDQGLEYSTIDVGPAASTDLMGSGEGKRYMLALAQPLAERVVDDAAVQAAGARLELYAHQIEAVSHLLRYSGCVLADDMGLGKSRAAICAARLVSKPTVIICPASLKLNWRNELLKCGERAEDITIVDGLRVRLRRGQWTIVNYENLEIMLRWPELTDGFSLIVDEAHLAKEAGATRTRRVFELAGRADNRWLLSATPMLNRASELYTLLRMTGHPAASITFREFKTLYSHSPETRELLGDRTREWMLRRTKEQLLDLPGKHKSMPSVTVPAELMDQYRRLYDDNTLEAGQKLMELRHLLERMKLEAVAEIAESADEDAKIVIFCEYLDTVDELMGEFGNRAVRYTGTENLKQRNEAVARFQDSASTVRYFIATTACGGLGLNLTAANYAIFASRLWSASAQAQAEDRLYRLGQRRLVEIIVPTAEGTIDQDIQLLQEQKAEAIGQVLQ